MTRKQKIQRARELREAGFTYREIGEEFGVAPSTVQKWCKPKWAREQNRKQNARRRPQKRAWEDKQRTVCPTCGGQMGAGSAMPSRRPKVCSECLKDAARARTLRYIEMRKQGMTNVQIADSDGVKTHVVAIVLSSAHRYGLTVPPSPYWSRKEAK